MLARYVARAARRSHEERDSSPTISPSADELIEEARAGRMFILVDDEDRENEGDLVIPAQFATPGRDQLHGPPRPRPDLPGADPAAGSSSLGLPLMAAATARGIRPPSPSRIEAREGVTTGISAHDRAHTIAVAINPEIGPRRHRHARPRLPAGRARGRHAGARRAYRGRGRHRPPGRAEPGRRDLRGHERRRHDGAPARPRRLRPAPQPQARHHRRPDRLPPPHRAAGAPGRRKGCCTTPIGGEWRLAVYANTVEYAEHLVLVKGDLAAPDARRSCGCTQVDLMGDMRRRRVLADAARRPCA